MRCSAIPVAQLGDARWSNGSRYARRAPFRGPLGSWNGSRFLSILGSSPFGDFRRGATLGPEFRHDINPIGYNETATAFWANKWPPVSLLSPPGAMRTPASRRCDSRTFHLAIPAGGNENPNLKCLVRGHAAGGLRPNFAANLRSCCAPRRVAETDSLDLDGVDLMVTGTVSLRCSRGVEPR